ncbi:MAG TPA: TRAP transporter large permease subunit [Burkholderiales bacterium]|nr:TRAP transporter large permease subunit [Burkholderiales bacterium]
MELPILSLVLLVLLLLLLGMGIWIGFALLLTGVAAIAWFTSAPVGKIAATAIWGDSNDWTLTALPMFLWMGDILFRTRVSEGLFKGLAPWLAWAPGRLLHVNIFGCALFSAVSGSSTATCATVSRIALPELKRRGYPEPITIGSLAGAGTLGILIPPSIIMIVYAVAAEVSILHMFVAGILPGLLVTVLFSGYIMLWSAVNPGKVPQEPLRLNLAGKLRASKDLLPCVLLVVGVIAGMFSGVATATEIGALGVVGALIVAAFMRTLNWKTFVESAYSALTVTCMIGLILMGSSVLSAAMALTGIPRALAEWVAAMHLNPYMLIAALCVVYLILGTALEGVAMILLTTSIALPMIVGAGFDPLWFGVFIVVMTELSTLSPPVGFNLFVLQLMTGRDQMYVARATTPFFLLLVAAVAIMAVFPEIVTWLPHKILSR